MTRRERDRAFMALALDEARKGLGLTSPNPSVGAVIAKGQNVLAAGYHHAAGQAHAEVEALRALQNPDDAKGATIYITLEPCSTHGRTPPCTDSIIDHGISRVVYGAPDPTPANRNRARRILRAAGIAVTGGVLLDDCRHLTRAWSHWARTGRPWVIAKCAMSLDGRISSHPQARWISSPESLEHSMMVRSEVDAILVGAETVRTDNPRLTVRNIPGARQPLRVVLSSAGNVPDSCHLLTDEFRDKTLIMSGDLPQILDDLGGRSVTSLLVEGGGLVLGQFFDLDLVDEVHFYTAPSLFGGPTPAVGGLGVDSPANAFRMHKVSFIRLGDDLLQTALVCKRPSS